MCYQPTPTGALVVGGGYYVLDRLADPGEVVTLVRILSAGLVIVRGARGIEYAVASRHLSPEPAATVYRQSGQRGVPPTG